MANKPDFMANLNMLPTPSPLLAKISGVIASPDSSAKSIADVLKLDPVIVSKILRLANSAYIGMPKTVSSLQNAIVLLGQKRIGALVTSALITAAISGSASRTSLNMFWRHSTGVGLIAESIARHLQRYHMVEPDVYFSAAVLHDIGKLVIAQADPAFIETIAERSRIEKKPFFEMEEEGSSHTEIGRLLAERWNFPDDLTFAIANHHAMDNVNTEGRIVHIVHLADAMAHAIGLHSFEGEASPRVNEAALAAVSLPLERLRVIAEEILQHEEEIGSMAEFLS